MVKSVFSFTRTLERRREKKERLKESVSETMDSAKSGLGKIFKKDRKAIEAEKGETIDE